MQLTSVIAFPASSAARVDRFQVEYWLSHVSKSPVARSHSLVKNSVLATQLKITFLLKLCHDIEYIWDIVYGTTRITIESHERYINRFSCLFAISCGHSYLIDNRTVRHAWLPFPTPHPPPAGHARSTR